MSSYEKGYIAYSWLEESGLDQAAMVSDNPEEFKRGYWQADNEMLQLKDDQERYYFDKED